jgi:Ca2+-binding EF-hand superfamily protein
MAAPSSTLPADVRERVKKSFDAHDTDHNGVITLSELGAFRILPVFSIIWSLTFEIPGDALREFGINLPDTAMSAVLKRLDTDGSGDLSFEEFCAFIAPYAGASAVRPTPLILSDVFLSFETDRLCFGT